MGTLCSVSVTLRSQMGRAFSLHSPHGFVHGPHQLLVSQCRRLTARCHQVGAWRQACLAFDLTHCRTKAPSQSISFHRSARTSADCICHTGSFSAVVHENDRHGPTPGALTSAPERLERRPVSNTPGHRREMNSGRQLVTALEPAGTNDCSPCSRRHPVPETVILGPFPGVGLVSALHSLSSFELRSTREPGGWRSHTPVALVSAGARRQPC
jgi:hypothetical protein